MAGRRWWVAVGVATTAMASSMLSLYAVSALAPSLVDDLGLSRTRVGELVTATFAVAAVLSLVAGHLVDVTGARRGLAVLSATVTAALSGASFAGSYAALLAVLALAGIGQALANPATNVLLARTVPPARRALAIGLKQSGVQLSAFAAGLVLPAVAHTIGWRAALRCAAIVPIILLALVWRTVDADSRPVSGQQAAGHAARPAGTARGSWWRWSRPSTWLAWLMAYSALLGTALAAVNTYLPLYASQRLGLGGWASGAALAAFGLSGLFGRITWTRWADRMPEATMLLGSLSAAAAVSVPLVWLAAPVWPALVWLGAAGIGGTATGANAVSMLAVVRRGGATGHASGLVSLGFFSGFVLGPTVFGLLADSFGYGWAWLWVMLVFAASAVTGSFITGKAELRPAAMS